MSIIEIKGLEKTYQVYQKKEGLRSSLRGLFKREYKQVKAVQGIDLQIEQGEFVAFLGPKCELFGQKQQTLIYCVQLD
jgi:ABC-2 type transport system ATP-binding protein